jgi:hypothetical protein
VRRLLAACLLAWILPAAGQADLGRMVADTQRSRQEGGRVVLVWWIPSEYWVESNRGDPNVSAQHVKQLVGVVDRYVLVAVIDGEISPVGGVNAKPYDEIIKGIQLVAPGGARFPPLGLDQLSPDMRTFLQVIRPLLANMLGQMGKGLEFVAFDGRRPDGGRLIDPRREERFTVVYNNHNYDWRLPLGSLLPPARDPKTGENFPGNYRFNPFTGDRLPGR